MAADDVAVLRMRDRADDGPAFACSRRAPFDREAQFCSGLGMRSEPDMFSAIWQVHRRRIQKVYGPPRRRAASPPSQLNRAAFRPAIENYTRSKARNNPPATLTPGRVMTR